MNTKLTEAAFGREAYLFFMVCVLIALAFSDLPVPIFLGFVAAILTIGLIAEIFSRLAARKLETMSKAADPLFTAGREYGTGDSAAALRRVLGQAEDTNNEPEFAQTENWFATTAVGSFA